tara:strand:+ start:32671 stop:32877 length:207 start_codon:yes stop_codon:yes gene_type:complete
MMSSKLGVSAAITCVILLFIFQNTEIVEITFLFWSLAMSRSLLILIFVGVGVIIGWLLKGHLTLKGKD